MIEPLPNPEGNPVRAKINEIIEYLVGRDHPAIVMEDIKVESAEEDVKKPVWSNGGAPTVPKWKKHLTDQSLLINRNGVQWPIKLLTTEQKQEIGEDLGADELTKLSGGNEIHQADSTGD